MTPFTSIALAASILLWFVGVPWMAVTSHKYHVPLPVALALAWSLPLLLLLALIALIALDVWWLRRKSGR